jgi:hypothetical protein
LGDVFGSPYCEQCHGASAEGSLVGYAQPTRRVRGVRSGAFGHLRVSRSS